MEVQREFPLSKESFDFLRKIAKDRCGIDLSDYRKDSVYNRLIRRIRHLHLPDFDSYCRLLRTNFNEETKFINLITNCSTSFFRENHHFEYLGKSLLPELIRKSNKIRIWSAGCATGEEPYSMAMVIRETIPQVEKYDIKILASDINSDALTIAQNGIYDLSSIKKLSKPRQKAWFERVGGRESTNYQINNELKRLVAFRYLNLINLWPMHGPFDVIFCRNVTIYFKRDITRQILARFHRLLRIGGVLFLGYSENLYDQREHYVSLGKTIYKRIS